MAAAHSASLLPKCLYRLALAMPTASATSSMVIRSNAFSPSRRQADARIAASRAWYICALNETLGGVVSMAGILCMARNLPQPSARRRRHCLVGAGVTGFTLAPSKRFRRQAGYRWHRACASPVARRRSWATRSERKNALRRCGQRHVEPYPGQYHMTKGLHVVLQHLEDAGSAHAAAYAHGHTHAAGATAFAFDQRMAGQALARHAIGVAHGDGAAVDVQLLRGNAQPVAAVDHLHGKGFVQFPQVDVADRKAELVEHLGHGEHRANAH